MLIYAWNPLVVWEFAGNAHVDAAVVGFARVGDAGAGCVGGARFVGAALAAATLTKFLPAVLFPAFLARPAARLANTVDDGGR